MFAIQSPLGYINSDRFETRAEAQAIVDDLNSDDFFAHNGEFAVVDTGCTQSAAENELASATRAHAIQQIPNGGFLFESPLSPLALAAQIERRGFKFQYHTATGTTYQRGQIVAVLQGQTFWTGTV